jgi:hypothetical protein
MHSLLPGCQHLTRKSKCSAGYWRICAKRSLARHNKEPGKRLAPDFYCEHRAPTATFIFPKFLYQCHKTNFFAAYFTFTSSLLTKFHCLLALYANQIPYENEHRIEKQYKSYQIQTLKTRQICNSNIRTELHCGPTHI